MPDLEGSPGSLASPCSWRCQAHGLCARGPQLFSPEIAQLVHGVEGTDEALKRLHIIRSPHLLHQEFHLHLGRKGRGAKQ